MKHSFDDHGWCVRCGCGEIDVVRGDRTVECIEASNVTAISHIARGRQLEELVAGKRTKE